MQGCVRVVLGIACICWVTLSVAAAEPTLRAGDDLYRPPIEWSSWMRVGYGVERSAPDLEARAITLPTTRATSSWQGALGADASLALSIRGNVRFGAWTEQRGLAAHDAFVGGELVLTAVPSHWDEFLYDGSGILALRAGRSSTSSTAMLAFGWLAPWWLEGPCANRFYDIYTGVCSPRSPRIARYMVGVRGVVTLTRVIDDPRVWSATFGIEVEPLGALRMLLVRRSWY
jgi:hypothetical protein